MTIIIDYNTENDNKKMSVKVMIKLSFEIIGCKHIKDSEERYLLGQNTQRIFGESPLSSY